MRALSFTLLIVLGLVATTLAGDCGRLTFASRGGKEHVYNLDPLTNLASIGASVTINGLVYNFDLAICRPLSEACPYSQDVTQSACYQNASFVGGPPRKLNAGVCQRYMQDFHGTQTPATNCFGQYVSAGANAFLPSEVQVGNGGVQLQYFAGDMDFTGAPNTVYASSITILCDKTITGTPSVDAAAWGLNSAHASFTIRHAAGCPKLAGKKGLSGGSICLIILTVAIVVYLAGGMLYNRFVKQRTGTGMIPNHTFWSNLPGLLADGFRFLICQPIKGAQPDYERVEG